MSFSTRNWRSPETLLILLAVGSPLAFYTWMTLLNNFAVEQAAFTGIEIGILQSLREVPGFLTFTVVFVLLIVKEQPFRKHPSVFVAPVVGQESSGRGPGPYCRRQLFCRVGSIRIDLFRCGHLWGRHEVGICGGWLFGRGHCYRVLVILPAYGIGHGTAQTHRDPQTVLAVLLSSVHGRGAATDFRGVCWLPDGREIRVQPRRSGAFVFGQWFVDHAYSPHHR